MSGQTIRDVVIKIRLEQAGQTRLQAPDTGPAEQAIARASKASVDAFSKEERAAVQAYSRITAEREKAARPLKDSLDNSMSDSFGLRGGTGADRQSTASQRDESAKAEMKANADAAASAKQRIEAYSQIGEGAIRAARGVAFLSASTDEDLRAAMQYIAAAQGVLDVYAGTAGAIKGLITLRTAQATSTYGAATAEGYKTLSTAAGTAADAASIPVQIAKIGATRAETAALGHQRAAAMASAAATTAANAAMLANPLTAAAVALIGAAAVSWKIYADAQKEAAATEKKYADFLSLRIQREREAATLETGIASSRVSGRLDLAGLTSDIDEQRRLFGQAEAQAARIMSQSPAGVAIDASTRQAQLQQEVAYGEELSRIQSARITASQGVIAGLEKQRDLAGQILNTAKQTVETEKDKLRTAEEKFGRLDRGSQERLKRLAAERKAGGQLSEADARFLDEKGLTPDAANQFFQKRGQEAGFDKFAEGFGIDTALKQARSNLQAALATAGEEERAANEDLIDELAKFKATVKKNRELRESLVDSGAELERLNKELEKLKQKKIDTGVGKNTD